MSFSVNMAILVGNVTKDPELKVTKNGHNILALNVATNHSVKQGDGSYTDVATFHRVIIFGKIAEWLSKNIKKGTKIYAQGRISTREYEDKEGRKQRSREIIADNVIPMSQTQAARMAENAQKTTIPSIPDDFPDIPKQIDGQDIQNISPDEIPF